MVDVDEDAEVFPSYTTPNGSVISIGVFNPFGFYKARYSTGGEMPEILKGDFTTLSAISTAIQNYIKTLPPLRAATENKEPPVLKTKAPENQHKGKRKKKEQVEVGKNISI
tara:strand:- start:7987 stop:8319 length:333 start_codon:yes stop_codon:yes gene_type:complete